MESKHFGTRAIHGGQHPDPSTGAVMPPIYQTSTYAQSSPGEHKGYEYSRTQNPTRSALEASLASIENGTHAMGFSSGLAAVDACMKLLSPGDEVISTNDLYGGTYRQFVHIYEKYGIKFHFVPMSDESVIESKVNSKTKMIWIESPTNPMLNVVDIEKVSKIARSAEALLVVDNTFATPYLQQPIKLGADIVLHSGTKYIGGHSDLVLGALIVNDKDLADRLYFIQNSTGAVCGPMDSFLALRGIKTLHIRMERHCSNAKEIAHFLKSHPVVGRVVYPGFTDHPGHLVAKKQMRDFGGMISFTVNSDRAEDASKVVSSMKIFTLAESLGGVESLSGHPASMTHASIPKDQREANGITDGLIRLSVGIEDIRDLKADIEAALSLLL
jgi:cystathionine beta-lyase|tara:strand:- start:27698 stop:28855 length:1158 start_codon:yes stop_codon:yes gene_type:complete